MLWDDVCEKLLEKKKTLNKNEKPMNIQAGIVTTYLDYITSDRWYKSITKAACSISILMSV